MGQAGWPGRAAVGLEQGGREGGKQGKQAVRSVFLGKGDTKEAGCLRKATQLTARAAWFSTPQ